MLCKYLWNSDSDSSSSSLSSINGVLYSILSTSLLPPFLFIKVIPFSSIFEAAEFPNICSEIDTSQDNAILSLKFANSLVPRAPDISCEANNKWTPVALPSLVMAVIHSSIIFLSFPEASRNICWNSSTRNKILGNTKSIPNSLLYFSLKSLIFCTPKAANNACLAFIQSDKYCIILTTYLTSLVAPHADTWGVK